MSGIDSKLFTQHEHALEQDHGECPQCAHQLVLKHSKRGPFVGCSHYPECDYTQPLHASDTAIKQVLEGTECPECSLPLALKQGRYGLFVGCTGFPECHHTEQLDETPDTECICPVCHEGHLIERKSRFGKTFYACNSYPKCQFAVNHKPKEGTCEECGFDLLMERKMAAGQKLQCADKKCGKFQSP
ncbi:DNA topoisomerase family protein [Echinimonas agarilytica]|uniref:Topoisomerase DNA-binding C4 zinc finger domain-containing protein n=1 Tax=Echinimonas agarilytica TaxID=1215918 RepID=A0AA41W3L5_9GAMM|nr:topoisomerase DNA-binding C4 zinc finger domain-containing protein [Echinimonas agarilytica]MCM2678059.1 topoisomerase DNA-binding C4 zinc finger domain-containing protein [Echinimonas agarilytica]